MEKQLTLGLSLLLSLLLVLPEVCGIKEEPPKKLSHSSDQKAGSCSYTFILPQQKLKGALCVNTGPASGATNHSEVVALREELRRQQEQLEELRRQLEQDGALVTEVLQTSASYRELEKKYEGLTSMMRNHSELISQLEKQCQATRDTISPAQIPTNPCSIQSRTPMNESADSKEMANDVQRDQGTPLQQTQDREPLQGRKVLSAPMAPTDSPSISFPVTKTPGPWRDCKQALDSGETTSGIYLLRPLSANRLLQAWCEQTMAQGGWTVIQRRQDGSVNFFRTWEQYKQGFGNLDGEYWLGLEHLYWLTRQASYKLHVAMEDWQGRHVFAEYNSFRLEPENDWYRLRLGEYQGNAGDSMSWHNNKAFTTLDKDKDAYSGNCAHFQKGGWWYHMCAHSNLNGVWYRGGHYRSRYQDGVYWAEFHGGSYSLKKVIMMIKPTEISTP
ncbi:angiopoietin-related protein 6 isoform X2 [Esox lucius]|uniref:angiopoietin-related protein 6 isoform X2 n=1 Tax=Esox lucius TaxID=8010 RepID=UPI001476E8C7|nr:angiopoietin-related protein 6 isoform X2 [Esox lucius]